MLEAGGMAHRKRPRVAVLRSAVELLWRATDGYARRRLWIALSLVVCGSLLAAATPLVLSIVIDSLRNEEIALDKYSLVVPLVLLYVIVQYFWRSSSELRLMVHGSAEQRLRRNVAKCVFGHLVYLSARFHVNHKAGATSQAIELGVGGYQLVLQHVVSTVLPVLIELAIVAVVLIGTGHTVYLAIVCVSALAYVIAFYRGAAVSLDSAGGVSVWHVEAHGVLTDTLVNHEVVKYFGAERLLISRYDESLARLEGAWSRFFRSRAANGLAVAVIFAGSLATAMLLATKEVVNATMTLGDFVLINAYIVRLVQPLEMLGFAVRDMAQGLAFIERMLEFFEEKAELESDAPETSGAKLNRGELAFNSVSFSYDGKTSVLRDVSFTVPPGKTLAIVGSSGSGKSTLIRLMFRFYEPASGAITIDGVSVADLPLSAIRGAIAVVTQDPVLFHDTIARNIGFGKFGASRMEIENAARLANLHDAIMSMPDGYETIVGERGLKLSGGERQRVAIARATLRDPAIAVFDEATSSLDSHAEAEIVRNLAKLSQKRTTLIIAHRLSTVIHADEIIVMNRGVVVERGTHHQLRARGGYYAGLWEAQQSETLEGKRVNAWQTS